MDSTSRDVQLAELKVRYEVQEAEIRKLTGERIALLTGAIFFFVVAIVAIFGARYIILDLIEERDDLKQQRRSWQQGRPHNQDPLKEISGSKSWWD